MLSESEFRQLVSGERRGIRAAAWRAALRGAETIYRGAVAWRNWRYDTGRAQVFRAEVPVVSVGNLTLGGTGKTPMVAYLVRWFYQHGLRVVIVSRGYRASQNGQNDEAVELHWQLPDVPHLQNPDRVGAVRKAVDQLGAQVIVLDDGFQHRRLARDLDLVLLDGLQPWGHRHVFPRGLLREPPSSLGRAHVIGLSRADLVDQNHRRQVQEEVRRLSSALWLELAHRPVAWRSASGQRQEVDALGSARVAAFCGIGNPEGFFRTLQSLNCQLVGRETFPDHYQYKQSDIDRLVRWADSHGAEALVCTGKDLVKINSDQWHGLPVWALQIDLQVRAGDDPLQVKLQQIRQLAAGKWP